MDAPMTLRKLEENACCPYWSIDSQECRVCAKGLFIPLDDHIEVYCKQPDYPQCLQYAMQSENNLRTIKTLVECEDNRRKYQRVTATHRITLVKLIDRDAVVSHLGSVAETIDLSMGGMRLLLDKPLSSEATVGFSFDDSFPEDLQHGQGYIAWCNKQIDDPGYQAGIAFASDRIMAAMGHYLNHAH